MILYSFEIYFHGQNDVRSWHIKIKCSLFHKTTFFENRLQGLIQDFHISMCFSKIFNVCKKFWAGSYIILPFIAFFQLYVHLTLHLCILAWQRDNSFGVYLIMKKKRFLCPTCHLHVDLCFIVKS